MTKQDNQCLQSEESLTKEEYIILTPCTLSLEGLLTILSPELLSSSIWRTLHQAINPSPSSLQLSPITFLPPTTFCPNMTSPESS